MIKDPLLQSFKLKHLNLKNRIITTSHEPAYNENGIPKERYIAYHLERAKGGIAMTMTAGSAVVSRDSPPSFDNIHAFKDEIVPWIKKLTNTIHDQNCAVMIQLTHLGRRTSWNKGDWLPSISSGKYREPAHRAFPKLLESWDIERIIKEYGNAAERMKEGGMDGIELEAHGHLMDQFWSPLTNELKSNYGGVLENRLRFTFDVLSEIRKKVGAEFIIGIRCVLDEVQKDGITASEGLKIARLLKESGQVDFLNVLRGRIHTDPSLTNVIPIQGMKSAPHLDFAGKIKKETSLPIFHASKISDVATARYAISNGLLDMVGMTRAHLADPHIVKKIIEKREGDIRPCVGATYCLDRIYQGEEALCIHNAATGRELKMPHTISLAPKKKRIVIVGAGPGGLEAARVAAERGHHVVVFEAASNPGGQIRLSAKSKRRKDMLGIIDWRMEQCNKKKVKFYFNLYAESKDVIRENPNVVIIATGGIPNLKLFETKKDLENIFSSWDIISGDIKPAEKILIYDEAGDHAALQSAEIAIEGGSVVELMTPDRLISSEIMGMNLTPYLKNLQNKKITFTIAKRLLGVEIIGNKLNAKIGSDYGEFQYNSFFDQVIINYGTRPLDELYFDLIPLSTNEGEVNYENLIEGRAQNIVKNRKNKFSLYRIGDAISSRNIHAAIYDALRLIKEI